MTLQFASDLKLSEDEQDNYNKQLKIERILNVEQFYTIEISMQEFLYGTWIESNMLAYNKEKMNKLTENEQSYIWDFSEVIAMSIQDKMQGKGSLQDLLTSPDTYINQICKVQTILNKI